MAFDTQKYFFWLKEVREIIWDPFWWVFLMIIVLIVPFLRPWWWIFAPLFLSIELKTLYLWWIGWDHGYSGTKWVMLEIVPPKETLVPVKAMEDVFSTMWGPLFDGANFRELWCEGILGDCPNWMSFEITSIEGRLHFFARVARPHRTALESTLYSYYPDLEIKEVSDYVKGVPQSLPNQEWDMYGEEMVLKQPSPYPIKTFEKFFEPQGERISAEEKRIDPINSLLESMSKLGQGEQYWIQIIFSSTANVYNPEFRAQAKEIIGEITKRPVKKELSLWDEIAHVVRQIVLGHEKEGFGEDASYKWTELAREESGERELLMSPGEREIVTEIENKVKKPVFRTTIRGVYLSKRENWTPSHKTLLRSYVGHFYTDNMNNLNYDKSSRTKVHYLFRKRR